MLCSSRIRAVGSSGNESESLYKQWASGAVSNDKVSAICAASSLLPTVEFRTAIYGRSLSVFSGNAPEELDPESESARNGSFHNKVRNQVRELTMHFDDSKAR